MSKQETIDLLRTLVRTRRGLIRKKKDRGNRALSQKNADFIQIHLDAYEDQYTDVGLASFFVRHQDKIRGLIPGRGSGSHAKLTQEFHRILFLCKVEVGCAKVDEEVGSGE
jgi:hypothetical protein